MVPLIFEDFAADIAARVAADAPRAVLETAAGSGVVTRALAPLLPADAEFHVTDLNPGMLARARARQPEDARIVWAEADMLALPCEDARFDAVVCQFGVMFLPDKLAGYEEVRRVLRRGAAFHFSTWDRIEENVLAHLVEEAVAKVFPDDPPRFMGRTPHGLHDHMAVRADLEAAGFVEIVVERREAVSRAPSARQAAAAFCQGTPLSGELAARGPDGIERAMEAAERAIRQALGEGPVEGKIAGFVFRAEG